MHNSNLFSSSQKNKTSRPKSASAFTRVLTLVIIMTMSAAFIAFSSGCETTESSNEPTVSQGLSASPSAADYRQLPSNTASAAPAGHTVSTAPGPLSAADKAVSPAGFGAKGALSDQDMTITDMLIYAIQDEYLARSEYEAIISKFGSQTPYDNIKRAEESHIASLKEVFNTFAVNIPTDTSADHVVIPGDLLEAAQTGVQAEIDNIAMYRRFLEYDLPIEISEVFTALMKASESHLLAFEKQVDRLS